jgi:hypothetical protein
MDKTSRSPQFYYRLLRFSVASLPYLYYISLLGVAGVMAFLLRTFRQTALDAFTRYSLLAISLLMIVSAVGAFDRGEAFLQLANFLPFFLLFAILPFLLNSFSRLERVAFDLLLTSIPINVIAFFEYLLKSPRLPGEIRRIPIIHWIRSAPHKGRAMVMFDHPNALASYLVLILGLGLGLILQRSAQNRQNLDPEEQSPSPSWLLYGATFLNLVGIFSSGSRNGILVAVIQLLLFSLCVKASRAILLAGVFSVFSIVLGAALFGIGGRALSLVDWSHDPRVGVWRIAFQLIQERPWLGWGLGNFKFLYLLRRTPQDHPQAFHPHNFWLLLSSEAGILVMLLLTVLVGYICFRAVKALLVKQFSPSQSGILLGYVLAFGGCVAFALFDVTFYDARINIINWILLAGLYSATASPESI